MTIVCQAASHSSKRAVIDRMTLEGDDEHARVSFGDPLDGNELLDHRRLFGTAASGPDFDYLAEHPQRRQRASFRCPLCGLTVPLKEERARTLAIGLRRAGVSSVSLEALAASV